MSKGLPTIRVLVLKRNMKQRFKDAERHKWRLGESYSGLTFDFFRKHVHSLNMLRVKRLLSVVPGVYVSDKNYVLEE